MTKFHQLMQIFRIIATLLVAYAAWSAFQEGKSFFGAAMTLVTTLLIFSVWEIQRQSQRQSK